MGGLLRLIQTPAEIQPQAMAYARFYLIGLPFLMVYDLSKQLAMACGDSRTPCWRSWLPHFSTSCWTWFWWDLSGWQELPQPPPFPRRRAACSCWVTCAAAS